MCLLRKRISVDAAVLHLSGLNLCNPSHCVCNSRTTYCTSGKTYDVQYFTYNRQKLRSLYCPKSIKIVQTMVKVLFRMGRHGKSWQKNGPRRISWRIWAFGVGIIFKFAFSYWIQIENDLFFKDPLRTARFEFIKFQLLKLIHIRHTNFMLRRDGMPSEDGVGRCWCITPTALSELCPQLNLQKHRVMT